MQGEDGGYLLITREPQRYHVESYLVIRPPIFLKAVREDPRAVPPVPRASLCPPGLPRGAEERRPGRSVRGSRRRDNIIASSAGRLLCHPESPEATSAG